MSNEGGQFRFNGRYAFVTYPQCTLERTTLWDFFRRKGAVHAIISTERHQDGNTHLHAVIDWGRKKDIRNARALDLEGFHPNIQSCKNRMASINYVKKDGDFEEFGQNEDQNETEDLLALAANETEPSFFGLCMARKIPYPYAKKFWDLAHVDRGAVVNTGNSPPPSRISPTLQFHVLPDQPSSIILVGPTGCGKTSWALKRAIKPALVVSHIDDLRRFDCNFHKTIIFDDMKFTHMPLQAQIHLVDQDISRSIHCRYGTATIPANTWKIFTCNQFPFNRDPAVLRRLTIIMDEEQPQVINR